MSETLDEMVERVYAAHDGGDPAGYVEAGILAERERCRGVANERAAQLWAGIQLPISDEAKAGWAGQMIEALAIEQRIVQGRVPVDTIDIEGLHKAAEEAGFKHAN